MINHLNHDSHLTELSEFIVSKSKIILNHDLTGIFPNEETFDLTQYRQGVIKSYKRSDSDYINGNKDDMLLYYNFILDN